MQNGKVTQRSAGQEGGGDSAVLPRRREAEVLPSQNKKKPKRNRWQRCRRPLIKCGSFFFVFFFCRNKLANVGESPSP